MCNALIVEDFWNTAQIQNNLKALAAMENFAPWERIQSVSWAVTSFELVAIFLKSLAKTPARLESLILAETCSELLDGPGGTQAADRMFAQSGMCDRIGSVHLGENVRPTVVSHIRSIGLTVH